MWNAIVTGTGWGIFYSILIAYVGWEIVEREFFASQDPEDWNPELPLDETRSDMIGPQTAPGLAPLPTLGGPA